MSGRRNSEDGEEQRKIKQVYREKASGTNEWVVFENMIAATFMHNYFIQDLLKGDSS